MRVLASVCLILFTGVAPLHAQTVAVTARAGTGGFGGGVVVGLTNTLNVRAEGTFFDYSSEGFELEGDFLTEASGDASLMLVSGLLDWHPGGGFFRVSLGAVYNGMEGSGQLVPLEPVEVGTRTYSPAEIGTLTVDMKPGMTLSPYAGIGLGNAASSRISFLLDIGALYMGSPDVQLTGTQSLAPMEQESDQIQQNMEWVRFYPLISLGLSFRLVDG